MPSQSHYACPHLPTCSLLKYNKKPCDKHCGLSERRVKSHTLNQKIHTNCKPGCPVYKISGKCEAYELFTFNWADALIGASLSPIVRCFSIPTV
jgi:hypothetical protein